MDDKIILTVEEVGIWAFEKFARQEKMIKSLQKANKRLATGLFFCCLGGFFVARGLMNNSAYMAKLQKQIDELKPVSE